jgi:hypothetical protein
MTADASGACGKYGRCDRNVEERIGAAWRAMYRWSVGAVPIAAWSPRRE